MNTYLFTSDEDLAAIGRGVLDRSLPKAAWTHRAHFAAAVWMLMCRPDLDTETALPPAIRAYNESTGVANTADGGYHETITVASIRAARAFIADCANVPAYAVCNALMASELGKADWPLAYWSRPILFSREARRTCTAPDLAQLPF